MQGAMPCTPAKGIESLWPSPHPFGRIRLNEKRNKKTSSVMLYLTEDVFQTTDKPRKRKNPWERKEIRGDFCLLRQQ